MEFKIGDVVKVVRYDITCGNIGKVASFPNEYNLIGVDFGVEMQSPSGYKITHNLSGVLDGHTGRYFLSKELELVNSFVVELL